MIKKFATQRLKDAGITDIEIHKGMYGFYASIIGETRTQRTKVSKDAEEIIGEILSGKRPEIVCECSTRRHPEKQGGEIMERVIITKSMIGLTAMQVCAVNDATDDEILAVCNSQNPAGASKGWSKVVREDGDAPGEGGKSIVPVQCASHADRLHFLITC